MPTKNKILAQHFLSKTGDKLYEIILGAIIAGIGFSYLKIIGILEQYVDTLIAHAIIIGIICLLVGNFMTLFFVKKNHYRTVAVLASLIIGILLGSLVIYNISQRSQPNSKFVVGIAQLDSPDSDSLTRENISDKLQQYPDEIAITPIEQPVKTDEDAIREGKKNRVDMLLWGRYVHQRDSREQALIHITLFHNASAAALLLPEAKGELLSRSLAERKDFVLQTDLGKNAAYVSLIVIGLAKYQKNDFVGAEKEFQLALKEIPSADAFIEQSTPYSYLGQTNYKQQKYKQAIDYFTQALRVKPNDIVNQYNRGASYYGNNELELAKKDYTDVIKQNPKYRDAYLNRGVVFSDQRQHELAIKDFDEVLKINPNDDLAYYNRGGDYRKLGNLTEALNSYKKAIQLNPERPNNYTGLAIVYRELDKPQLAIDTFTEALKHNPPSRLKADAYYLRGMLYLEQQQLDKAFADFDEVLKATPSDASMYNSIAGIYYIHKKIDKALAILNLAIQKSPTYAPAYTTRGNIFFQQKKFDKALTDYNTAIRLEPETSSAYTQRGIYYMGIGNKTAARIDLQKAHTIETKTLTTIDNPTLKEALQSEITLIEKLLTSLN